MAGGRPSEGRDEAPMTDGQRMAGEPMRLWPAGEYTLLSDSHTTEDLVTYSKGDTLTLDERTATRLGNAGAIAPPSGIQAIKARVESGQGTRRDEYLYQMWKLSGVWD
jgi:hypothetical protein